MLIRFPSLSSLRRKIKTKFIIIRLSWIQHIFNQRKIINMNPSNSMNCRAEISLRPFLIRWKVWRSLSVRPKVRLNRKSSRPRFKVFMKIVPRKCLLLRVTTEQKLKFSPKITRNRTLGILRIPGIQGILLSTKINRLKKQKSNMQANPSNGFVPALKKSQRISGKEVKKTWPERSFNLKNSTLSSIETLELSMCVSWRWAR